MYPGHIKIRQVNRITTAPDLNGEQLLVLDKGEIRQGNTVAEQPTLNLFIDDVPNSNLAAQAASSVGGSQPHTNFQPYLCVNFIISMFGIFPSPS